MVWNPTIVDWFGVASGTTSADWLQKEAEEAERSPIDGRRVFTLRF